MITQILTMGSSRKGTILSTKLSFFIAGFGYAAWAPLVPYAKERLSANTGTLGIIMLCLGLGAMIGMPTAGILANRIGCKKVIVGGAFGLIFLFPFLTLISNIYLFSFILFLFGLSLGAIDIAANVHAAKVQIELVKPLMPLFHGFYSIGGLVGVALLTVMLGLFNMDVVLAASIASLCIGVSLYFSMPNYMNTKEAHGTSPVFVWPKGSVIILGLLCLVIFLAEGALLDWGALLLIDYKGVDVNIAGIAYVIFALALAIARFTGTQIVLKFGENTVLFWGFIFTAIGLACTALSSSLYFVLTSILITGLAAGNVIPILFSLAGKQTIMPVSHAISAVGSLGYLGLLLGPAIIGYIAHGIGLNTTFYVIAGLTLISVCLIFYLQCLKVR